jgi:hypothetical protein
MNGSPNDRAEAFPQSWGTLYMFHCPGCDNGHIFHCRTDGGQPSWDFNGNLERPTFSPSIKLDGHLGHGKFGTCHSYVRDGRIEFLSDCTHDLAGRSVELPTAAEIGRRFREMTESRT